MSNCKLIYVQEAKAHRAIFGRFTLPRGRYVLVPFLEEPLQEAAYILRIFLPKSVDANQWAKDTASFILELVSSLTLLKQSIDKCF
ncbi:unnamed protein product [Dibothriocephalus latus]|uniref:Peptidase C2 calpain large subunit domain-containing protein n=1 Tax=Dibothriocephalus latus TaxID=60516 RepID=A0A3P7LZI8_DIBLA|nr:unnamed protein product [Dibothriocephalus latus]